MSSGLLTLVTATVGHSPTAAAAAAANLTGPMPTSLETMPSMFGEQAESHRKLMCAILTARCMCVDRTKDVIYLLLKH